MAPPQSFKNKKDALVKDVVIGNYYNLTGEVVKMFWPDYVSMDLYITDYTENKDLFPYLDPNDDDDAFGMPTQRNWPGPFGQVTIAIRLWDPHAAYAKSNIKEGDIVYLQNVHARLSNANRLEGAIHEDERFPTKICVHKCTRANQIAAIAQHKAVYEKEYQTRKDARNVPQNLPKKPSAKASAKKKEKKLRQRKEMEKEIEKQEFEKEKARADVNPHVRAGHHDIKLSTLAEINQNPHRKTITEKGTELELPFVNSKYRTRVRVIDLHPLKLENFSHCLADPKYNPEDPEERRERLRNRFEWGFTLLVEDTQTVAGAEPERLMIIVNNEEGQRLLKMDAVDLEMNPGKRKQLEENLFILWGNLRERKIALREEGVELPLSLNDSRLKLQNKPFECCLQEVGEQIGRSTGDPKSWVRRFYLFNTTIMH